MKRRYSKRMRKAIHGVAIGLLMLMASTGTAQAVPEEQAIRGIIGEASGEGYRGMLAIAAAIRNRGTLKGVYGVDAPHIKTEPQTTWAKARMAWEESKQKDPTKGATVWGNEEDVRKFRRTKWFWRMERTAVIGSHQFFREKKKKR